MSNITNFITAFGGRKMFWGFYFHLVATIILFLDKINSEQFTYITITIYGIMAGTNAITTAISIGKEKNSSPHTSEVG